MHIAGAKVDVSSGIDCASNPSIQTICAMPNRPWSVAFMRKIRLAVTEIGGRSSAA